MIGAPVSQQRPHDPRELGGKRHDRDIWMRSREQPTQPCSELCLALAERRHRRPGTLDQRLAQVSAATLGDPEQARLAAGGCLTWHQTEPCSKIATAPERVGVTDRCDQRRRVERPDTGDGQQPSGAIIGTCVFDELGVETGDPAVERLPALTHVSDG